MIFYLSITALIITLVLIFYNYKRNNNSLLLAGYLFPVYLYGIKHYIVFESDSIFGIAIFHGHFSPIFLLPGAMLYLYIRNSLKNEWKLTKKDLLHFLPFFIDVINVIPFYSITWSEKIATAQHLYLDANYNKFGHTNLIYPFYAMSTIRVFLFLAYIIASSALLLKNWKNNLSIKKEMIIKNFFRWLTFLNGSAIILAACTLTVQLVFLGKENIQKADINDYYYTHFAYLIMSTIPLVMIFYPQVIYGVPISLSKKKNSNNKGNVTAQINELDLLAERILSYFEISKPYLNHNFTLDDLATELGVTKQQIYVCLNKCIGKKFIVLRTSFRIEHAKQLLLSSDIDKVSLQGIWMESGFSSKTNFFTTFKEETGLTPLEFIENQNK
jgi:AraC-like DNA-binding protein